MEGENKITLKDFISYSKNHILLIVITIFILFLAHNPIIFFNNIGIDTYLFFNNPATDYNWMQIGRYGLIVEKFILNLTNFSIFYANIIFIIFLILSCIILYYTIYKISNKDMGLVNICIPLIGFTHPILAEQLYFANQIAEIGFTFFIVSLAALFIFKWIKEKKILYSLFGIILLNISLASYQAFAVIYIAICIFLFIAMYEDESNNKKESMIKIIFKLIVTFFISIALYEIIINLLPNNDMGYLMEGNAWKTRSFEENIAHIKYQFAQVFLGEGDYYNIGFGIGSIVFLAIGLYNCIKKNNFNNNLERILYLLSNIMLVLTPFFMTILLGQTPLLRAQIYLPIVEAFFIMVVVYYSFKNKYLKFGGILLAIVVAEIQCYKLESLYYTENMRLQGDINTVYRIINDLEAMGAKESDMVILVGEKEAQLNETCSKGESIGKSLFEAPYATERITWYTSRQIILLFRALGYEYPLPRIQEAEDAEKIAETIDAVWPEEGSIVNNNGCYIVKLSEEKASIEE